MRIIDRLTNLQHFCCTVGHLPTSYVASMSFEEQIEFLRHYLDNEIIPKINEIIGSNTELQNSVEDLKKYVDNYFKGLDVQEEINKKLEEMVEDGTLAEIINQEIFEELNTKINKMLLKSEIQSFPTLALQRKLRYFVRNGNHPEHVSGEDYPILQGGTYTGNEKMVIVKNRQNKDNELQEISLIDGSIIRSAKMDLGHGNSITFNPETKKLYITGLIGEDNHKLYVVDYLTFTLETTLIFNELEENEGILAISYDLKSKKYYLMSETGETHYQRLYELNIITQELNFIELLDFDNVLSYTNTNDMMVYNNVLYVLKYNPMLLAIFDLTSNKLLNIYNINNIISQGTPVGELQNISIKYDNDYENLLLSSNRLECIDGFYNMFQFFETNLNTNISENIIINNFGMNRYLQVDINSTSINPNGTSTRPFKHLSEAVEVLNSINGSAGIQVTEGIYPFLYINGVNKKATLGNSGNKFTIQGLQLKNTNGLYIFNAIINNLSFNQNVDISVEYSNVRFNACDLSSSNVANMYLHNSTIEIGTMSNVIINSLTNNNIICYDETPTYKVIQGNMPNMNKPVKLCNGNLSQTSNATTYNISDNPVLFNAPNIKLMVHANYAYEFIELPNRITNGTRLFSIIINNWVMTIQLTRTATNIAFNINSCKNLSGNNVVDNTQTASGDFVLYAKN